MSPWRAWTPPAGPWVDVMGQRPDVDVGEPPPPASPPGPVTSLWASVPGGLYNSVRITWAPPVDDGGAPIMFYRVRRVGATDEQRVNAPNTSFDWTDLIAGVPQRFTVVAVNASGDGPLSTSNEVVPVAPPPPPPPPGDYFGWDPASWNDPPRRSAAYTSEVAYYAATGGAYHTNTGLFRDEDRAKLRVWQGDFVTSQAGQLIPPYLDITGNLIVNHPGVKGKLFKCRGQIRTTGIGTGQPPKFYFPEFIYRNGVANTDLTNLTDGHVQIYGGLVAGYIDGTGVKKSAVKVNTSIAQDCFFHSPRTAMDSFYSPPDVSHSDLLGQINQSGGHRMDYLGCTAFLTAAVNFGGTTESLSRDDGPGWTPGPTGFSSSTTFRTTGGDSGGRINAGFMLKSGIGARLRFHGCLFRGYAYTALNIQAGSNVEVVDCYVAPGDLDRSGNPLGNPSNIAVYRGNKTLTGASV